MATKSPSPRESFIHQAECALGRPLRPEERKSVIGFDAAVVRLALESLSNQEIAGMVSSDRDETRTVGLLGQLASGTDSVAIGWQKLLGFLQPKERKVAARFDLDANINRFSRWLLALLRSEPLPAGIRALNFGLFESDGGCRLYVTGAKACKEADSDWACANDWFPEGRYAPLDDLSRVYRLIRKTGIAPWVVVQAIALLLVRGFFEAHSGEIKTLLRGKKLFIASGFDDGDLYPIRTSFTS